MKKNMSQILGTALGILLAVLILAVAYYAIMYGWLVLLIILVFGTMGIFTTIGQLTGKGKK